ncbi:hypothetical protein HZS_4616, partial [Henneguya salminicola]
AIQLELYPNQIYQSLLLKLKELYGSAPYPIPGKSAVYRNIREQRSSIFSNSIQAATLPPLRYLANSQPYLRRYWSWDIDGEYYQMLIWCTNEALSLMRYNSHMFVYCTFRSALAPFTQWLIVMVHDAGTEMFVPCVYSLITSKSESIYLNVFPELIVLTKYNWMLQIITCDFELSLISAIKHEFPSSRLLCWYFHLKKGNREKIKNIYCPNRRNHNCTSFWSCLDLTWRRRFEPQLWKISNINDNNITGRTNNALEIQQKDWIKFC